MFDQPDYAAAARLRSPHYIYHSAHIEPGREGLISLIESLPPTLKYEPGTIVAEGRRRTRARAIFRFGPPLNRLVAAILLIEAGIIAEDWDVIRDEAIEQQSTSGAFMFGQTFLKRK